MKQYICQNKKNRKTNKKGFTMLELLMVVIVIGILASLAIPKYQDFSEKARTAEALKAITVIKSSIVEKLAEGDSFSDLYSNNGRYILDPLNLPVDFLGGNLPNVLWGYAIFNCGPQSYGEDYTIVVTREKKDRPPSAVSAIIYYFRGTEIIAVDNWPLP